MLIRFTHRLLFILASLVSRGWKSAIELVKHLLICFRIQWVISLKHSEYQSSSTGQLIAALHKEKLTESHKTTHETFF